MDAAHAIRFQILLRFAMRPPCTKRSLQLHSNILLIFNIIAGYQDEEKFYTRQTIVLNQCFPQRTLMK